MKSAVKYAVISCCVVLSACSKADWKSEAIADAEDQIRTQLDTPSTQFSRVQLTGNSSTGQTCGFVTSKAAPDSPEATTRFIVYIDGTAGPYIESKMDAQAFETAWQNDCRREGYDS